MPIIPKIQLCGRRPPSHSGEVMISVPSLPQFMVTLITRQEISVLSHKEAVGDAERFQSELAFLLILPERVIQKENWHLV